MKIQLHTPKGIREVNTETVSDIELAKLGINREILQKMIPLDVKAELQKLQTRIEQLESTTIKMV